MLLPNSTMFFLVLLLLMLLHPINSTSFNFSSFHQNMLDIFFQGDAFPSGDVISVTKNQRDASLVRSVGRASYAQPIRLYDAKSSKVADFTTHFSFSINALNESYYGDGLAFFLLPFDSQADVIPTDSFGGFLGLFSSSTALDPWENQVVAIEFDSFQNYWDPSSDHVGIDVNSIASVANVSWQSSIKNGAMANAWVSYNSSSHNLSVFLTYAENPVYNGESSVSYVVNLRDTLPELVRVGFSAATGDWIELHTIYSWSFSSTLDTNISEKSILNIGLVVGVAVGIGVLSCGLGLFWFVWWRRRAGGAKSKSEVEVALDDNAIDDEFDKGAGPKRFTFFELSRATSDFSEEGKLGEGGFGGVYKGLLSDDESTEIAVKRFSSGSKQGKKEYVSEVKIISRLRHRNLVQLIGWCHEKGEFLLVYELMPNGSLDSHLFGGKGGNLTWTMRHKIGLGIASALLYLHEEWEQCVVHRDIKSSNVMLDSNYNAKLGDFGLARLVDHDLGSQTTVLAGTMGYLAPECVTTGKASKESDVYSFGVVALEITCGRKPVEVRLEPSKVRMVEWVWDLYGKGMILEACDNSLTLNVDDKRKIECLMIVGLWCCHPDYTLRPSIRQVINVLNFEAPLPNLPSKLPVPMYYAPPMDICRFSYTTSEGFTDSGRDRTQGSGSSCTTTSTTSAGSRKNLLKLHQVDV